MKSNVSNTKSPWHKLMPGLKFGIMLAILIRMNAASAQTPVTKDPKTQSTEQRVCDSLINANWKIFNAAQDKYFDRLDKKYSVGRFFTGREIAKLNKIMKTHMQEMVANPDKDYAYVKSNMPIRRNLPLNTFIEMFYMAGVNPAELTPFGMIFEREYFYTFADAKRAKLLEDFANDSYAGLIDDGMPNYDLPEFAKIRDEYTRNQKQIESFYTTRSR